MSRKSRRGYFVDGEFIAAGSAADRHYRNERKGTDAPSRTERKLASEQLQALGEQLVTLPPATIAALALPARLEEAIGDARRITSFQALRRQKQFIGKLMHRLDAAGLEAVSAALELEHARANRDVSLLHEAEQWRDDLVADDARLGEWLQAFPGTDVNRLRSLLRQHRKQMDSTAGGHGNAYRQILRLLREQLSSSADSRS